MLGIIREQDMTGTNGFAMYKKVCAGKVTLKTAQDAFREDWVAAYKKYVPLNKQSNFRPFKP